jgi:chemotaxis protein CheD
MGELAVTRESEAVLTTIGLGSCVGLALLDAGRGAAGLAHVVLPTAPTRRIVPPGKFADTAVPALLAALTKLGSVRSSIEAVLIGGARMFSLGQTLALDVGTANVAATREALAAAEIPIRALAIGGSVGRSVRVSAADGTIFVRTAGADTELYRASEPAGVGDPR